MEKEIKMAARLYECRDTVKSFARIQQKDYMEMLKPYIKSIKQVMKANGLEEIPALLRISKTKTYEESGMVQLLFMASVVELIEAST